MSARCCSPRESYWAGCRIGRSLLVPSGHLSSAVLTSVRTSRACGAPLPAGKSVKRGIARLMLAVRRRVVAVLRRAQLLMAGAARWKRVSVVCSRRKAAISARVMVARMWSRPR